MSRAALLASCVTLSNDPVAFLEGQVQTFNRYSYVSNDPVNAVDPDGRIAFKVVKQLIKNRGNIVKTAVDVGGDVITVISPSSTPLERIESAVSLASPVDFDDARAAQ